MTTSTFSDIKNEYDKILQLPPKEKYKQLVRLCKDLNPHTCVTLEDVDLCQQMINRAKKVVGFPGVLNAKLQALLLIRMKLLNIDPSQVKNIFKKKFTVNTETAIIGLGDSFYNTAQASDEVITQGQRVFISTSADGVFTVEIRIVNTTFPVFTNKEYASFIDSSDIYLLHVPTGDLILTDYHDNIAQAHIQVPAGIYRLAVQLSLTATEHVIYHFCLAKVEQVDIVILNPPGIPTLG